MSVLARNMKLHGSLQVHRHAFRLSWLVECLMKFI
jgi:hypothetical protein